MDPQESHCAVYLASSHEVCRCPRPSTYPGGGTTSFQRSQNSFHRLASLPRSQRDNCEGGFASESGNEAEDERESTNEAEDQEWELDLSVIGHDNLNYLM